MRASRSCRDLDVNTLTGTLPTELGRLSAMNTLYVNDNTLTGTLPTELLATLHPACRVERWWVLT